MFLSILYHRVTERMETLDSTQENIEKALGEAITARSIALDYYSGLGPPDICCLNKAYVRAWMPSDPSTVPPTGCSDPPTSRLPHLHPPCGAVTRLMFSAGTFTGWSVWIAVARLPYLHTLTRCSGRKPKHHGECSRRSTTPHP